MIQQLKYDGVVNVLDPLEDELVRNKIFINGRVDANNFLTKFELHRNKTVNQSDFIVYCHAMLNYMQITHFKNFIKNTKKNEERRKRLEETQEKAREMHRQQQMALLIQAELARYIYIYIMFVNDYIHMNTILM